MAAAVVGATEGREAVQAIADIPPTHADRDRTEPEGVVNIVEGDTSGSGSVAASTAPGTCKEAIPNCASNATEDLLAEVGEGQSHEVVFPELLDFWANAEVQGKIARPSFSNAEASAIISLGNSKQYTEKVGSTACERRLMLSPDSTKRITWDILSLFVLGYDVMMTPLLAFDLPEVAFMTVADLCTTAFWTIDIVLSFTTGYREMYAPEMRWRKVAVRYMSRTFVPDLLIAGFDWSMYVMKTGMANATDVMRVSKFIRAARILRILRLLRLMRLPGIFRGFKRYVQSEATMAFLVISRSLLLIIVVNHFVACAWYAVGFTDSPSWVGKLNEERDADFFYSYFSALHWSITQFTPASMEVVPTNAGERAFAICVVFFGLVLFGSFVSSITTTMAALRASKFHEIQTKEKIRRYMCENNVSMQLGSRISNFLMSYRFTTQQPVHRKDIAIFRVLPKNLQLMLDWEVNQPVLSRHPLLHHVSEVDSVSMLQLSGLAEEMSLSICQELFHPGKQATAMYFTLSGILRCYHGFDESNPMEVDCMGHRWLCEPALWLRWRHRGRVVAVTTCSFLVLGSSALHSVISHRPRLHTACMEYARLLRQKLLEMSQGCQTEEEKENATREVDMFGDFGDELDVTLAQVAFDRASIQPCSPSSKTQSFRMGHSSSRQLATSRTSA